jgi:hypothetical protein
VRRRSADSCSTSGRHGRGLVDGEQREVSPDLDELGLGLGFGFGGPVLGEEPSSALGQLASLREPGEVVDDVEGLDRGQLFRAGQLAADDRPGEREPVGALGDLGDAP